MIFGRPTGLIVGAFTAVFGAVVTILGSLPNPIIIPLNVVGAITLAFGALVAVIANQPPTLNIGDPISIVTPKGQPNYTATVAAPPAATKPVATTDVTPPKP